MKYKVEALEAAVKYLSAHNPGFRGQHEYIREAILDGIRQLNIRKIDDYETMGFRVSRWCTGSESVSIQVDMNILHGSWDNTQEV